MKHTSIEDSSGIRSLLMEVCQISVKLNRPLVCRPLPVPGKKQGDPVEIDYDEEGRPFVHDITSTIWLRHEPDLLKISDQDISNQLTKNIMKSQAPHLKAYNKRFRRSSFGQMIERFLPVSQ